jgi:hypothetical protein
MSLDDSLHAKRLGPRVEVDLDQLDARWMTLESDSLSLARDTAWTMSEKTIALAHQSFEAVNRRDLGALLDLCDENVEAVSRIAAVEGGLRSHGAMRRWWENWFDAFPDYTIEVYVWTVRDGLAVLFQWFQSHREALEAAGL